MITATYILLSLTGIAVLAAIFMVFRNKIVAVGLTCFAIMTGVGAFITSYQALNTKVSGKAYQAVELAASSDDEVDAVAQFFLEDGVITTSEYSQIADVYREKTGKEISDLIEQE